MTSLGLIAPLEPLASEYETILAESGIGVATVVTDAADSHDLDDVTAAGADDLLSPAAADLARQGADAVVWACTSGSFAAGLAAARRQVDLLADAARCPATSTSVALLDALQLLGVDEISLLSPYPQPVTDRLLGFLADAGVAVAAVTILPTQGPSVSSRLDARQLAGAARTLGSTRLVVVPDTAIPGCVLWPAVEIDAPVVFANQWTLWRGLTLVEAPVTHRGLGVMAGVDA